MAALLGIYSSLIRLNLSKTCGLELRDIISKLTLRHVPGVALCTALITLSSLSLSLSSSTSQLASERSCHSPVSCGGREK